MSSPGDTELRRVLGPEHVDAIAAGATLIASGGGGNATVGDRLLRRQLAQHPVSCVPADELPADALIVHVGIVGSPDVLDEKLLNPADLAKAAQAVVATFDTDLAAVGPLEVGGLNAMMGVLAAGTLGVPVIDGDLMGRAFPKIRQTTLHLAGGAVAPVAVVSPSGDLAVIPASSDSAAERLILACTSAMGGLASLAMYPTTAGTLAGAGVRHSLSRCVQLGEAYLASLEQARTSGSTRNRLVQTLGGTLICDGTVDELRPRDNGTPGSLTVNARQSEAVVRIDHVDEYLAVTVNGQVVAQTPDLIVALDSASLNPLRTDQLRLGQNVTLFSLPAMHEWPDAAATLVGAEAFGLHLEVER